MTAYHDLQQQSPFQNPQTAWFNPQLAQTHGLGQAAYGQHFGQYGGQQFGQPSMGAWGSWGQHRQLSQNEVGDVVRQLVPLLPQLLAQAQLQPQAAFGYGGFGQGYGQIPKLLTQHDVNEVVRQILPILPQLVGMLQGQGPWQGTLGGPLQAAAMNGGLNSQFAPPQNPLAQFANPWQQNPFQQWSGQQSWPQAMPAYGPQAWSQQAWGQRNLTQQDASEVARQLVNIIPQVISNLQTQGQQRMN
jgi:hypothetical protein